MDREQEEAVQRITAQYIAELRAGRHPRLSDYLSHYPRYASAITNFVTYYHATEKNMPGEAESMPPLSETSRAVLDRAWNQEWLSQRATNDSLVATLQVAANNQGKSLPQLVMELGLSIDILDKLDRHIIDAASIPEELCKRLANALHRSLSVIETYLGLSTRKPIAPGIAEAPPPYHVERQPGTHIESFREAIEQSMQLSNEQKDAWRSILTKEEL
jgi:hypothetical protein